MRGWAIVAVVAALAAGCASEETRDGAEAAPATSGAGAGTGTGTGTGTSAAAGDKGGSLYDLPDMRKARVHRERGATAMQEAYRSTDPLQRDNAFGIAWKEFKASEDAYHEALTAAAERFRPVIENDIASVAEYMRQIQRDRVQLKQAKAEKGPL